MPSEPHTEVACRQVGHRRPVQVRLMGRINYGEALGVQEALHARVVAEEHEDTVLVLEHGPTVTVGRHWQRDNLLVDVDALRASGTEFFQTGRGGDITYHGPGQLVVYPIFKLLPEEQDIKCFVHRLEEVIIRTAYDFGVAATRIQGLRGIWVGNDKLAAIGVRLAQWTSSHGFALNVTTDLAAFDAIVPCGLHDKGVTSFKKLLGQAPEMRDVQNQVVYHIGAVFERTVTHRWPPQTSSSASERMLDAHAALVC